MTVVAFLGAASDSKTRGVIIITIVIAIITFIIITVVISITGVS